MTVPSGPVSSPLVGPLGGLSRKGGGEICHFRMSNLVNGRGILVFGDFVSPFISVTVTVGVPVGFVNVPKYKHVACWDRSK